MGFFRYPLGCGTAGQHLQERQRARALGPAGDGPGLARDAPRQRLARSRWPFRSKFPFVHRGQRAPCAGGGISGWRGQAPRRRRDPRPRRHGALPEIPVRASGEIPVYLTTGRLCHPRGQRFTPLGVLEPVAGVLGDGEEPWAPRAPLNPPLCSLGGVRRSLLSPGDDSASAAAVSCVSLSWRAGQHQHKNRIRAA